MFISELLSLLSNVDKDALRGKINLGNKNIKSISSFSSNAIYYFPTIVSDQCTAEEVTMISKALEKQYANFVVTCIGLIPFHRISSLAQGSVDEYLKIFHQNIGIDTGIDISLIESAIRNIYTKSLLSESSVPVEFMNENYESVNDKFNKDNLDKYSRYLFDKHHRINEGISVDLDSQLRSSHPKNNITGKTPPSVYNAFDSKAIFSDMEMKKANEAIPTVTKVNIGFIVDETDEVIERDVLVGIKTFVHRVSSSELVNEFYNSIINRRKFLKFVKYITGEERSLSDLILGINELKTDATDMKSNKSMWFQAFKRRKRWSKMTIPFIMKSYTPNGTVVMTMNEVNYIRDHYGIDIMKDGHIKMIMDNNFLLGFVILDQANEMAYITYDSHNYEPQEYSYNALEREMNTNDRMMRELYRSFSSR